MNYNQLNGKWHQVKGSIRAKWGEVIDDELAELDGNREKMVGKIQEKYGMTNGDAKKQLDFWINALG
jgi:uncharacterized protein YjbJ (UPF0337 family)